MSGRVLECRSAAFPVVVHRLSVSPPSPCPQCAVQVKLELGHRAQVRKKPTVEGFTHDWMVFVRGPEHSNIQHFVEKVVFHLHESFPRPKRGRAPGIQKALAPKKNVLAGGGNNCLIAWPGRVPPPPLLFLSPPTPTPLFAWLPAGREPRDPARSATPQPHARANPTRVSGKSPQRKGPSGVECLFNAKFSPYQVLGGGVSRGFCGEGAISSWVWRGGELGLRRNQHSASLFIPEKSPFLLGFASNTCNGA